MTVTLNAQILWNVALCGLADMIYQMRHKIPSVYTLFMDS